MTDEQVAEIAGSIDIGCSEICCKLGEIVDVLNKICTAHESGMSGVVATTMEVVNDSDHARG